MNLFVITFQFLLYFLHHIILWLDGYEMCRYRLNSFEIIDNDTEL